jgi:hypothetical protein
VDDDDDDDDEAGEPPGLGPEGVIATRRVPAHKWVNAALSRCLRQAGRLPGWASVGGGGRGRQPDPSKNDVATWAAQALTVMEELLAALPVTLEAGGGGSVERCGLLVAGGTAAVEEAAVPTVGGGFCVCACVRVCVPSILSIDNDT